MRTLPLHGEQAPTGTFVKSALIDATHFLDAQFSLAYLALNSVGWTDAVRQASDQAPSATFIKQQIQ